MAEYAKAMHEEKQQGTGMLEELTDAEIEALENQLLGAIPLDRSVGNVTLLRELKNKGWADGKYWSVRDRLVARGALTIGRGRGGSVMRAGSALQDALPVQGGSLLPHDPASNDGTIIELQVATGGRILAIVQGSPTLVDINELHRQLLACFAADDRLNSEYLSAIDEGSLDAVPSDATATGDDPDDSVQNELNDIDSVADLDLPEPILQAARRPNRNEEMESLVARIIESIDPRLDGVRASAIVIARYGLGDDDEQTLDVVGQRYDVTRERVRQIEAKVIRRLQFLPDLGHQAREALSSWITQLVEGFTETGSSLTNQKIESLCDDKSVVDGWILLALDVAFPVTGAQKRVQQLAALADHALHRYSPFSMFCWVTDPEKSRTTYPIIEEWLDELLESKQSLPLPADTFASLLGVGIADVLAVVSAHKKFTVYAGYVCRDEPSAYVRRAIRLHVLAVHLAPDSVPISQFVLWQEYRRRFEDIDACSSNDLRIAASDKRGAPHLFVLDNNNSLFALGFSSAQHGLDLEPRFPTPDPEVLRGDVGQLMNELRHGPATAETLAESIDMPLVSAMSQLGQRPNVISVTPRYYGLAGPTSSPEAPGWRTMDLIKEDALEIIGCRLCGEEPESVYQGWTPAFEFALCKQAERDGWDCLPQLLWVCKPKTWPLPPTDQTYWCERKTAIAQRPKAVSLPVGSRLPDPVRLLRFLLVIRQTDGLSAVMANRVTRPRGVLQQVNGTLLAILARVGALQQDADTWWAKHRIGPEAARWYAMLADEYLQYGELSWTKGACLEMVQEAASSPGTGWACGPEWTQRISNWAAEVGVEFKSAQATATDAIESDEACGTATDSDGLDVSRDFVDALTAPGALTEEAVASTVSHDVVEAEELAKLILPDAADTVPSVVAPQDIPKPAATINSISVLVSKAQTGDLNAQYQLAKQLQDGIGAAPNMQAAQYWLERAAHGKHVPACVRLGRLLLAGELGDGSRKDRQQGLVYLNAGTKIGNATACYLVAMAYRDGSLTRKNPNTAIYLLKRAAQYGHGRAAYELALMLRERMHAWVPDTIRLLDQAAAKGVTEAIMLREDARLPPP
ncbi:sigma factor-like helix-turn-helix DNA-binding protein [Pseudoxanthomonas mexicana]|uniref:sigma factor-like helix-turn-helix DNA-binding protein n=1 Tax=Pseudoxanthomonas mexicana TaxID=128785 RepID=UPI00398A96A2